jgi:aspartate/methionine/tyrosine aminotransferase
LKPTLPDGTFYLWVDVGEDGEAFAQKVLEDLHIIVVPGKDYGIHTQNYIRISYAMETEKIEEACRRFRNAFKK